MKKQMKKTVMPMVVWLGGTYPVGGFAAGPARIAAFSSGGNRSRFSIVYEMEYPVGEQQLEILVIAKWSLPCSFMETRVPRLYNTFPITPENHPWFL
jgi:hypothetical protein